MVTLLYGSAQYLADSFATLIEFMTGFEVTEPLDIAGNFTFSSFLAAIAGLAML